MFNHMFLDNLKSAYGDALKKGKIDTALYLIDIFDQIGVIHKDGGEGSGNWGHEGREGKIGGSAKGGGVHNRETDKNGHYTSFSKKRKELSKPHKFSNDDIEHLTKDGTIVVINGEKYETADIGESIGLDGIMLVNTRTGEILNEYQIKQDKPEIRVFIPSDRSPNYSLMNVADRGKLEKQFNNAVRSGSPEEADELLREESGKVWSSLGEDEKKSLLSYTGSGYVYINEGLRFAGNNKNKLPTEFARDKIVSLTNAIDKSGLASDTILYRGMSRKGFEQLMGLPAGGLAPENVDKLVGRSRMEYGFSSCGSCEGKGMPDRSVLVEVMAPKGTKALYVEPFSSCGMGNTNWNGTDKQVFFSQEQETVIQQGSRYTIIGASFDEDTMRYKIKAVITSQKPRRFE